MNIVKVFTIQDALNWHFMKIPVYSPGTSVKPTAMYSGGDEVEKFEIMGTELRDCKMQPLTEELMEQGYTHQELYTAKWPDGKISVLWPEECEAI
jgi:hypothetical protein